jgi:hypothetical protein
VSDKWTLGRAVSAVGRSPDVLIADGEQGRLIGRTSASSSFRRDILGSDRDSVFGVRS